jgi:glycosyltransferase involved in cell wall biosynthesis
VIPPTTELHVRKRLREIGRILSKQYDVYMLRWHEPEKENFIGRVHATLKDIIKKSKVYKKENLYFAEYPFFHRPFFFTKSYNPYSLEQFLIKHNIDVVINGVHYFFPTPKQNKNKCVHIFDINDLPTEEVNSHAGHFMYDYAKREVHKAGVVTACSHGLVDYIWKEFGRRAYFIPNGTYLDEFRTINFEDVRKIRQKYNILNKFVIGYIGFIGDWIDVDLLISLYDALRNKYNDVALMVVGAGPKVEYYRSKIKDKDIIFTGGIPQNKISPYFFSIDAGLLPSKKSLFQDLAFHTKLIEYTAAKKMVISSPLEEVQKMAFPNILIAHPSVQEWMEAIDKIRQSTWNPAWDNLVSEYDWKIIGNKFTDFIENRNV